MERDDKQSRALIGWIRFSALIFFLLITQGGATGVCVCFCVCVCLCVFICVEIIVIC